jgi:Cation transporting ATPase, C-terminus
MPSPSTSIARPGHGPPRSGRCWVLEGCCSRGVGIGLQLAVVAVPLLHDVFDTTSLTGAGWLLSLSAGLVAPIGIWVAG